MSSLHFVRSCCERDLKILTNVLEILWLSGAEEFIVKFLRQIFAIFSQDRGRFFITIGEN